MRPPRGLHDGSPGGNRGVRAVKITFVPPHSGEPTDHVVICGANALTSRMAEELTARYGLTVTVIVPSAADRHAARMTVMPGVTVLERAVLDSDAFLAAGLPAARGLAIVHEDDLGNFHAALRAQELSPGIRLVIAMFNVGLGVRIRSFFTDCAVLSQAQMAAPSLVAAALSEPAPSHVRMAGRTLYVARRENVGAGQIVCGLAASSDAETPSLVPPGDPTAGIVLAVADGTPRNPLSRRRRRRLTAPLRLLRRTFGTQIGLIFAALVVVLIVGFVLLAIAAKTSVANAIYLTLMDTTGDAVPQTSNPGTEQLAQILLTFDSLAFVPVVTAAFVRSRLPGVADRDQLPESGHVIVAGLGTVGTRVVGQLHDLGLEVVAIDKSPDATGLPLARQLGVRVVFGEAHRDETLRTAGVTTCRALVSVTNSDIANLETALNARALAAEPRIVVRLYDDDLAARVQAVSDNTVSRSTSYLAAPEFAAALLNHHVLRTIAVGRHVLLLADVAADDETVLAGERIGAVHRPDLVRVIALRRGGSDAVEWSPAPDYLVRAGDRVVVVATRAGLSGLLRRDNPDKLRPAGSTAP
jgi:Trk K+ transport system NAD-binding subunit